MSRSLKLSVFGAAAIALVACNGPSEGGAGTDAAEIRVSTTKITLANWMSHPQIVAVRHEVEAIDLARYPTEKKELCEGRGEAERTKSTDASGKIRTLVIELGSEDHVLTERHYYDAKGTLRFMFETGNDVHGNSAESRVYFDENGVRIWDVYRQQFDEDVKTDIATVPFEVLTDPLFLEPDATDPAKMWSAPARCD